MPPAPRRYLAVWFPFLPTDRLRLSGAMPDELPLVLTEKQRGALRLAALDAKATRLGLQRGMMLAEARAIVPALAVQDHAPDKDRALLFAAAEKAMRFTPMVAVDGDDGLLLDIAGCAHLFGGEHGMLALAQRCFTTSGLTTRCAMAGTPEAAHAFARFTRGGIVPVGADEAFARSLPVTALQATTETTLALARAGLKTLGDLACRPSHLLTARFGAEITLKLHAILGHNNHRITPLRAAPLLVAERHCPEPLALTDSLMAVLAELSSVMAAGLEARGEGGRVFEAVFFRSDGIVRRLKVETAEAMRDPHGLLRLLRLKIEMLADPLDPGFGFDAIRLAVLRSEALDMRQHDLAGAASTDAEASIAALVSRLIARFGRDNILRCASGDSHDPLQAGLLIPYLSTMPSSPLPQLEEGEPPLRPLMLFAHPHPIEAIAEVPDGPPIRFRWRRVLHNVTRAEGPERIAPQWWQDSSKPAQVCDYYRVEDEKGHRFWLFRNGLYGAGQTPPRWFLHGLFA